MDDKKLQYLFHQGTLYDAYNYMGCHISDGQAIFRVWAPNAEKISVIGDFNGWNELSDPMQKVTANGVWEVVIKDIKQFDSYKYYITRYGKAIYKADPYAFHSETKEKTNSKVYNIDNYTWDDSAWIKNKELKNVYKSPMNIYEVHIGSWRKTGDGNFYNYRTFADEIVPYLLEMRYTHLEIMGIAEHPYDGSWGYQVTGYYAPTSRYGTPEDFVYLVNKLHINNVGVILDWVPGHFPKDACGLYEFDGSPLYEPTGEFRKEHKEWGTRCFDYGRTEVQTFLVSNAMMWLDKYHIDGLRVDAVASMLYLDYGRKNGEWSPNKYGGKENIDAIEFFKKLNSAIYSKFPNSLMIAEESTAWPLVTKPVDIGGLGFNFKWNMGWMNDSLDYAKTDPYFRYGKHNNLTFSMSYAFSENYILPISHDEVVHGKASLVNKMAGTTEMKFAGFRNYLMNMYGHPGKKLIFMGTEWAQFREWDFKNGLEWGLLDIKMHADSKEFTRMLNNVYIENNAFWEIEDDWSGYEWLVPDDSKQNVIAYERRDMAGNRILCVMNFAPIGYKNYAIGIDSGTFKEILVSDIDGFGRGEKIIKTINKPSHNKKTSIKLDIAPLSGIYMFCKAKPKSEKIASITENKNTKETKPQNITKKPVKAVKKTD